MSEKHNIALIISLNFRAAHISHLVASYRQMEELGFESWCVVHPDAIPFLPKDVRYTTDIKRFKRITISVFWFPSLKNISMMLKLKIKHGSKILYVFHEPIESFATYRRSGNSIMSTINIFCKYYAGLSFLFLSDRVLLPSNKAVNLYKSGMSKYINGKYDYFPLMYPDERTPESNTFERIFISYIGGISKDHAFSEFVEFIWNLYKSKIDLGVRFLIASWQQLPQEEKIDELIASGALETHCGHPMTNEEINKYYAKSYFVWNAYNRTTQSGVLAKGFMFGTPAIVMREHLSEFIEDGREVIAISDNKNQRELAEATQKLVRDHQQFSIKAIENFHKNYDYHIHNGRMNELLEKLRILR